MKTSVRRGLFHPDDIKTVGLAPPSPGPKTAPLPDIGVGRTPRQPSPGLPASASASPFVAPLPLSVRSHSHSPSLAGSSSGSIGKSDARRLASSEFNKYAEDDDEDYDDVFGKPNGSCACFFFFTCCVRWVLLIGGHISAGTSCTDPAAQHAVIEQVLGKVYHWMNHLSAWAC